MRTLLLCSLFLALTAPVLAAADPCADAKRLLDASDAYDREEGIHLLSVTPGCRGTLGDDLLEICAEDVFYNADFAYQTLRAYYRPSQVAEGQRRLLANFTARLRDPDPGERLEAAERLGKHKREAGEALPALLPLCRDEDPDVALGAAKAILAIDGDDGTWVPVALRNLLEHDNGNVQIYALRRIAKLQQFDEQTMVAVQRLSGKDVRKNVRRWANKVISLAAAEDKGRDDPELAGDD